jgi:hypothetical protein
MRTLDRASKANVEKQRGVRLVSDDMEVVRIAVPNLSALGALPERIMVICLEIVPKAIEKYLRIGLWRQP